MQAQALLALGRAAEAREKLLGVLKKDPNHPFAEDFLSQVDHAPNRTDSTNE